MPIFRTIPGSVEQYGGMEWWNGMVECNRNGIVNGMVEWWNSGMITPINHIL